MSSNSNRRSMLKTMVASGVSATWVSCGQGKTTAANRIQLENAQAGTRNWMLERTRVDPATKFRCPWVEGYASHCSLLPGQKLKLMVSCQSAKTVSIDIFRLGYYGGMGGRLMHSFGTVPCHPQSTPEPGKYRLMNCDWQVTAELEIPASWTSGVYVAKLTEQQEQLQSYIIFIVRSENAAPLVFQCSDHTWQAYNRWPSQFSLYDDGKNQWYWGGESEVSFNRPYGKYCQILDAPLSLGSGEFFLWEFPFVYWMESLGYEVCYISNSDTHHNPAVWSGSRGLLSVGHDEYWTIEMYHNVQAAISQGISVGFFSGNAVCGKVAYNPESRSLRRTGVFGPPGGTREFDSINSLPHERPYANELIGAHSTGPVTGGADWVCTLPEHWIYQGTGMRAGDRIAGLIGWEFHGDPAKIAGLEIVATGPTQSAPGELNGGIYTATVYPGPRQNFVFNAGTCWWSDGLSSPPGYQSPSVYTSPQGVDPRVKQMTRNILDRMLG